MSQLPMFIDLARCRTWPAHPRRHEALTLDACQDLITSMAAVGQLTPAIVRPVNADPRMGYEIICGARRHAAATFLAATGRAVHFIVAVRDLTDEQAFRLADADSRKRSDLSDHERATAYAAALHAHYDSSQKHMAGALSVTASWLSRFLALASLPPAVVAAFGDPAVLRTRHAAALRPALNDPRRRAAVEQYADAWSAAQKLHKESRRAPIPAAEIVRQLLAPAEPADGTHQATDPYGNTLARGTRRPNGSTRIDLSPEAAADHPTALAAIADILRQIDAQMQLVAHAQDHAAAG